MKKISILCAALAMAALSFTSCQKEESATANQKFIASFEQAGNDKVTVNDDLQMYWEDYANNSMIGVFAPGHRTNYYPSTISDDGKTAVLEYNDSWENPGPFPANQQGPFYAVTNAIYWGGSHINADGSFHVGEFTGNIISWLKCMPMIARADNFGALKFKHLFGILKIFVNLPEGYTSSDVNLNAINGAMRPTNLSGCDVYWDANGDISMTNISFDNSSNYSICHGNGFYFTAVCPGDWGNLQFVVHTIDENQQQHIFVKEMASNATIHIERAGITTLTLNMTENNMSY